MTPWLLLWCLGNICSQRSPCCTGPPWFEGPRCSYTWREHLDLLQPLVFVLIMFALRMAVHQQKMLLIS